jgi:hypothetical protein
MLPSGVVKVVHTEYGLLAVLVQYTLRLETNEVSSVMAMP